MDSLQKIPRRKNTSSTPGGGERGQANYTRIADIYGRALAFTCFYCGAPSTQPLDSLQVFFFFFLFFKISAARSAPRPTFQTFPFGQTSPESRRSEVAFATAYFPKSVTHPPPPPPPPLDSGCVSVHGEAAHNRRSVSFPCCLMRHLPPRACSSIISSARGETAALAPCSALLC